jgi:predicted site-specific integrase-resolvase
MLDIAQSGSSARPTLRSWDDWLNEVGVSKTTGWRWRKAGWIQPVNICGRLYVSDEAIGTFVRRAEEGEFSQVHTVTSRKEAA